MILEESVIIATPPERVAAFFEALDRHYRDWHPDHIAFRWLTPERDRAFFAERIGRWTLRFRLRIERNEDGRVATCRPVALPVRLFFPWMAFSALPDPAGCRYVHRIKLRLGPLRPLLDATLVAPLRRHMREETGNLPRLLTGAVVAKLSR